MKTKTMLSILTVLLLAASSLPALAIGQTVDDIHSVDISVSATEGDDDSHVDISITLTWEMPGQYRAMADADTDNTVSSGEAADYAVVLDGMSIEELQEAYKSHVWNISMGDDGTGMGGGGMMWDITTTVTGLEGATDDDTTDVVISITLGADNISTGDAPLALTLGPLVGKDGTGHETPEWGTSVTVTDGTAWCASSVEDDAGTDLTSAFAYHANDTYSFTATFGQDGCEDVEKTDTDKDGVPDEEDQCAGTPDGATVFPTGHEQAGCEETVDDTDTDGDGVLDGADACTGTAAGAVVDDVGCSADQIPDDPEEDGTFNVTFTADVGDGSNASSYTCTGMTNTSSAADCMTGANFTVPSGATVAAGHPHHWAWSLQVNGVALADQDAANLILEDATSTFAWNADGCTGDCRTSTVHEVTNLSGMVMASEGDCVWFNGVSPTFTDGFDNTMSYRCFATAGDYTSGDLMIMVDSAGTGEDPDTTDPIDPSDGDDDDSTPGFGLVVGITAALGAALIAARRD